MKKFMSSLLAGLFVTGFLLGQGLIDDTERVKNIEIDYNSLVYPNPATVGQQVNILTLTKGHSRVHLYIHDLMGVPIAEWHVSQVNRIQYSFLKKGYYIITAWIDPEGSDVDFIWLTPRKLEVK